METTAFDTKSSLNPKGDLAPLMKALAKLSKQAVQPAGNSLFAGMLGPKISRATLLDSTPDPPTAAHGGGGKHPLPDVKGIILSGKGEPATGGKAKPAVNHHPRLSVCNNEPLNGTAGETASEMINHSSVSEMEKSTFEEVPTLIGFQPVMASSQHEDAPLSLAGPAGKKSLSLAEKAEPTKEAKTSIQLAKGMMEHAIAMPVTGESVPHADPSPTENATRQIAPPCESDAALFGQVVKPQEAVRLERETDELPTGKSILKEALAPASHEVLPLSDRHADRPSPGEGDERGTEAAFMQRAHETQQRKNSGSATYGALSDERQASPSLHNQWNRTRESKEGAALAAAPQKPISVVSDGQPAPERMMSGGSPDKTIPTRDAATETPGPAWEHQQSRNTTTNHPARLLERDMFPFHMEMPNIASPQGINTPATVGPTGIDMQAVIDQLLEARQVVSNDSGRIRILLNPPNLGSVDLDIVIRGERVEVVMTAENATVQQALQSRGDDIRIALQRQDLKIEGFQVLLQDNGTSQQQTNSGGMYRHCREHQEIFNASEDAPPPLPVFSPIAGAKSASGLVSIFA
jgi:flagellar hook-length control protein FliK